MSVDLRARKVDEVSRRFQGATSFIIVGYSGLRSNQASDLRAALRGSRAGMRVVKNSTAALALKGLGHGALAPHLAGPTALIYGASDAAQVAKTLITWNDANEKKLEIRGALVAGLLMNAAQVTALSKLPPREQLLAQFVGMLAAPTGSFVRTLHATLQKFVGTLDAVTSKLPAQG